MLREFDIVLSEQVRKNDNRFILNLPSAIKFKREKWKVGITRISYFNSFGLPKKLLIKSYGNHYAFEEINHLYFKDPIQFITYLNRITDRLGCGKIFQFEPSNSKVSVAFPSNETITKVKLPYELSQILGFSNKNIFYNGEHITAEECLDLHALNRFICFECNICSDVHFANTTAQIIKTLNIDPVTRQNSYIEHIFDNPELLCINADSITQIVIISKTLENRDFYFTPNSKIQISFHFKRTMDDSFYITLPSNVDAPEYPNNRANHFITPLPRALNLEHEKWEVGLSEINYPYSWYTFAEPINLRITNHADDRTHILRVMPGFYGSSELLVALNQCIRNSKLPFIPNPNFFLQNIYTKKVMIDLRLPQNATQQFTFTIDDNFLVAALGFKQSVFTSGQKYVGENLCDTQIASDSIYIYSNIVRPTIVGNKYLPLIRTIATRLTDEQTYVNQIFLSPQYIPLNSSYINEIEIQINDTLGRKIEFQFGKVVVKLHFRKIVKRENED